MGVFGIPLPLAKPDWEEEPKDVETSAGTSATFICKANGFPEPNIAWFINGIKLEGSVNLYSNVCDADRVVKRCYLITISK